MTEPVDDGTALSRRRAAEPVDDVTAPRTGRRTPPGRPGPADPANAVSAPGGPRRRGRVAEPLEDASTITRSRSRGRTETETQAEEHEAGGPRPRIGDAPVVAGRVAHPPADADPYRARTPPSPPGSRRAADSRVPQTPVDTAAVDAASRRRRRRRAVVVVAVASAAVVLTVLGLVALLTTG